MKLVINNKEYSLIETFYGSFISSIEDNNFMHSEYSHTFTSYENGNVVKIPTYIYRCLSINGKFYIPEIFKYEKIK